MPLCLLDLPNEVLLQILKHLSGDDIHFRCVLINRRFRDLIQSEFDVVNHLRLRLGDEECPADAFAKLKKYCRTEKPNLKCLTIDFQFWKFDEQHHQGLVEEFFDMTEDLRTVKALQLWEFDNDINLDLIEEMEEAMSKLNNLRFLHVQSPPSICLWLSLARLEHLTTLSVKHCFGEDNWPSHTQDWICQRTFPSVTRLSIDSLSGNDLWTEGFNMEWLWIHFPNLEALNMTGIYHSKLEDTFLSLRHLSNHCPQLESLALSVFHYSDDNLPFETNEEIAQFQALKRFRIKVRSLDKNTLYACQGLLEKWTFFGPDNIHHFTSERSYDREYWLRINSDIAPDPVRKPDHLKRVDKKWILDKIFGPGRKIMDSKRIEVENTSSESFDSSDTESEASS